MASLQYSTKKSVATLENAEHFQRGLHSLNIT